MFTSATQCLDTHNLLCYNWRSSTILNIHNVLICDVFYQTIVQCVLYRQLPLQTWWPGKKSFKQPQTWIRADKEHEVVPAYL